MNNIVIGIAVVVGLIVLYLVFSAFLRSLAVKKHPNFYEEMQFILREILLPLDFEEDEGKGFASRTKYSRYSRGELETNLWVEVLDSIYHFDASSSSEDVNDEKRRVLDISIECFDMRKADEFKGDLIEKLEGWLKQKGIK